MAIITHTFIKKSNTLFFEDKANLGRNPIIELYYGSFTSRCIIYFDVTKLKQMVDDKIYPDINKLKHTLKLYNVGVLNMKSGSKFNSYNDAKKAASFDLRFFLIDREWDGGDGYDYFIDGYDTYIYDTNVSKPIKSFDGSNWFKAKNRERWMEPGIYSNEYLNEHPELIIAEQHFDTGNEHIELDLTNIVNDMILGNIPNYGIGIAFTEDLENIESHTPNYVGFFTDHTHTYFNPYVESRYEEYIEDDRTNFFLDKANKLYFYAIVGNEFINLDTLPVCSINGAEKAVKQATKGVYYVDMKMDSKNYEPETMYYDNWTNIIYKGHTFPEQELYFTTKPAQNYFTFGLPFETKKQDKVVPYIYGINHKERIEQGDVRKVNVGGKIAYTTKQEQFIDTLEYCLYVKQGNININIIDWAPVEKAYNENYFFINTNELIPGIYYIDLKIKRSMEIDIHKEMMEFEIIEKK